MIFILDLYDFSSHIFSGVADVQDPENGIVIETGWIKGLATIPEAGKEMSVITVNVRGTETGRETAIMMTEERETANGSAVKEVTGEIETGRESAVKENEVTEKEQNVNAVTEREPTVKGLTGTELKGNALNGSAVNESAVRGNVVSGSEVTESGNTAAAVATNFILQFFNLLTRYAFLV